SMDKDERQRGSVWPKAPIFRCRAFDDAPYLAAPGRRRRPHHRIRRSPALHHSPATELSEKELNEKEVATVAGRRRQRVALTDRASMDKDERQRGSVWPKAPIFRCRAFDDAPYLAAPGRRRRPHHRIRRSPALHHSPATELSEKEVAPVAGRRRQRVALTDRASMDK